MNSNREIISKEIIIHKNIQNQIKVDKDKSQMGKKENHNIDKNINKIAILTNVKDQGIRRIITIIRQQKVNKNKNIMISILKTMTRKIITRKITKIIKMKRNH